MSVVVLPSMNLFMNDSVPIIVALSKPNEPLPDFIVDYIRELEKDKVCKFYVIDSLSDLPSALGLKPEAFIFCDNNQLIDRSSMIDFMAMFKSLIHFTYAEKQIKIAYLLEKTLPRDHIKELQKVGIFGLVPSLQHDRDEVTKGIKSLIDGIPYWPKHLIDQLPGSESKKQKMSVHLTGRQQEVLNLITNRGLSNKQIAKILGISESTVKIHVSAIMKAYCVRNRTQLVLSKK